MPWGQVQSPGSGQCKDSGVRPWSSLEVGLELRSFEKKRNPYFGRTHSFHSCQVFSENSNPLGSQIPSKYIPIQNTSFFMNFIILMTMVNVIIIGFWLFTKITNIQWALCGRHSRQFLKYITSFNSCNNTMVAVRSLLHFTNVEKEVWGVTWYILTRRWIQVLWPA